MQDKKPDHKDKCEERNKPAKKQGGMAAFLSKGSSPKKQESSIKQKTVESQSSETKSNCNLSPTKPTEVESENDKNIKNSIQNKSSKEV